MQPNEDAIVTLTSQIKMIFFSKILEKLMESFKFWKFTSSRGFSDGTKREWIIRQSAFLVPIELD
jgi:hypothetical protein